MSDQDASLGETATGSTTISTKNSKRTYLEPDWDNLSPAALATKELIATRIEEEYSPSEIAKMLGISTSSVLENLEEFRAEVDLQSGFINLSDDDFDALRSSIKEHGVRVPIVIGEHIKLVDGKHRFSAAVELGVETVPVIFLRGLTEQQEHDLSVSLNVARRHLTSTQKRVVVRRELSRSWGRSDRSIALLCGVSHPTVATIREAMRLEEKHLEDEPHEGVVQEVRDITPPSPPLRRSGQVENSSTSTTGDSVRFENREGADGKSYLVTIPEPKPEPETIRIGRGVCPHGEMVVVSRHRDGHLVMESERD